MKNRNMENLGKMQCTKYFTIFTKNMIFLETKSSHLRVFRNIKVESAQ